MLSRVLAVVAAFVLTAVASAPPALGQTATTTHDFKIVHGAIWRGIHDGTEGRYLTFGCAPVGRGGFGTSAQDSVVTFNLWVFAYPRGPGERPVWKSETSSVPGVPAVPLGKPCNLRKGLDTVTFQIPEGMGLDGWDPYLPFAHVALSNGRRFRIRGTHGRSMYRLRDYSRPLRGTFSPPPPPNGTALDDLGVRSYISEPERGRRRWRDGRTGEMPAEKRAAQRALYGNRRRARGNRGRRLQRRRGELMERPFAHRYETGGMRRVWVRGHEQVRKRVLIQAAGCNIGLLLRDLIGVGTPRSLQGRVPAAIFGLIGPLIDLWMRPTRVRATIWPPTAFVAPTACRQAA